MPPVRRGPELQKIRYEESNLRARQYPDLDQQKKDDQAMREAREVDAEVRREINEFNRKIKAAEQDTGMSGQGRRTRKRKGGRKRKTRRRA